MDSASPPELQASATTYSAPHRRGLRIQTVDHPTKAFYYVLNSDGYPVATVGDLEDAKRTLKNLETKPTQNPQPNEVDVFA